MRVAQSARLHKTIIARNYKIANYRESGTEREGRRGRRRLTCRRMENNGAKRERLTGYRARSGYGAHFTANRRRLRARAARIVPVALRPSRWKDVRRCSLGLSRFVCASFSIALPRIKSRECRTSSETYIGRRSVTRVFYSV